VHHFIAEANSELNWLPLQLQLSNEILRVATNYYAVHKSNYVNMSCNPHENVQRKASSTFPNQKQWEFCIEVGFCVKLF